MSNIRVDVSYTIQDGSEIVFRSPVDCSAVTGLIVSYPGADGNTVSKVFALADAHGNNVGDIDHLFAENVVVKVILDVTESMAFVQNADTNAYLEAKFEKANQAAGNAHTAANNAHTAANNAQTTADEAHTAIDNHKEDMNNPHAVTCEQIGAATKAYADTKTSMTLLWENASPTSAFAEQMLAIDWTPYDFLRIVGLGDTKDIDCVIDRTTRLSLVNMYADRELELTSRVFRIDANGVKVGVCRNGNSAQHFLDSAVLNTKLIPLKIYGIKGVIE